MHSSRATGKNTDSHHNNTTTTELGIASIQNSGAPKAMALRLKNGRDLPSIGRLLPEEGFPPVATGRTEEHVDDEYSLPKEGFPPVATGRTRWHMQRVLIIISGLPGRPAPEPTRVRIFSVLHCKAQHSQSNCQRTYDHW